MLPTFTGPCWELACPKCLHSFRLTVDYPFADKVENARYTSCPFCGFSEVAVVPANFCRGSDFYLPRVPFKKPEPARWDLSLFKIPNGEGVGLKRVAGFPGETVDIRRGTVFINGVPQKKPLEEWSFRPIPLLPENGTDRVLLVHTLPIPYLESAAQEPKREPSPITNVLTDIPRLEPTPLERVDYVDDFVIFTKPDLLKDAPLLVNQGDRFWLILFDRESSLLKFYRHDNGTDEPETAVRTLTRGDFPAEPAGSFSVKQDEHLSISLRDESLTLCGMNGKELLSIPNKSIQEKNLPIVTPAAFLAESFSADQFSSIEFCRDIGYSVCENAAMPRVLGCDEYFLLGDNPAVSIDSRDWKGNKIVLRKTVIR